MSGPKINGGQSIETPVLNIDIAPTLLHLAGVANRYDDMDGLSIMPLLTNETKDADLQPAALTSRDTTNNTVDSGAAALPIIYNYTGIQGRQNFLVEYSGEGSAGTSSDSCAGQLHNDLANLSECSAEFGCKCQDARNNTYTCLRTIGQENTMFCQFEDSSQFLEMYNLAQDPEQLTNLASMISEETIGYYKVKITHCKITLR